MKKLEYWINISEFKIVKQIRFGKSAYSKVYLGEYKKKRIAVKQMKIIPNSLIELLTELVPTI